MNLPIISKRWISYTISSIVCFVSLVSLLVYGLKPGIDFTGGTLLEVEYTVERPSLELMKEAIVGVNQEFEHVFVQPVGEKGYIIKLRFISEDEHQQILSALRAKLGNNTATPVLTATTSGSGIAVVSAQASTSTQGAVEQVQNVMLEERIETVGPAVSTYVKEQAWKVIAFVTAAIIGFIAYSFRKVSKPVQSWKYGVAAVIALIHDVLVTVGVFSLLGHFRAVEVDIPFVVALLTIFGYSVNDTIIVYDRIREKLSRKREANFAETVNAGVNETVTRSINTSGMTLLVIAALYVFGGETIHYFALALLIGIASGTYSSIFIASPILVTWEKFSRRKV